MLPIIYISLSQFIFATILIFTKPQRQASDVVLGYWLGLMVLFLALVLMEQNHFTDINLELFPFAYTLGPFLYLYVKKLTSIRPQIRERDLLHLLPFAFMCVMGAISSQKIDEAFVSGNVLSIDTIFYSLSITFHVIIYTFLSVRRLIYHRKHVLDLLSYQSPSISLQWLYMTFVLFITTFGITFIFLIFQYFFNNQYFNPGFPFFSGLLVFVYVISFFGARQPAPYTIQPEGVAEGDVLRANDAIPLIEEEEEGQSESPLSEIVAEIKSERYANSGLSAEIAHKYKENLIAYFDTEKPFMKRELNAQMVSKHLGIKQHHLTEVMNEYVGKNFYTFVNEYRVNEVKNMLKNKQFNHYSLLGIAYEAGFNSKSSFNTIFKKMTGYTPTEYKQLLDKNQTSDL